MPGVPGPSEAEGVEDAFLWVFPGGGLVPVDRPAVIAAEVIGGGPVRLALRPVDGAPGEADEPREGADDRRDDPPQSKNPFMTDFFTSYLSVQSTLRSRKSVSS